MTNKWQAMDIDINGIKIHYNRLAAENKPALVLIHGFTDNGLCWSPVASELEGKFDIIMPDMHGHGLSSRYVQGEEVDMAKNVAELIKALKLNKPIICGHSMGAMVTFELGHRIPSLVKALVLEDPPWWQSSSPENLPPQSDTEENPVVTWARTLAGKTYEELLSESIKDNPEWPLELQQHMCAAKKQLDQSIIDTLALHLGQSGITWDKHIAQINCPVLLITGNPEKGAIVSPEVSKKAQELNHNFSVVNVQNVGHLIRFDNHPTYMKHLLAFLNSVLADS